MGKNWHDPLELQKESKIYAAWVLVLAGVAAWDVCRTIMFDLSIISGKRKWRWPMILYFADRIFMLIHIFAYAVNLNAISEINCDTVVWMSKITDMLGTCTSSLILVLRTNAVWHQDRRVTIPLGLLCIGQVVLWAQTMRYSKSIWNPQQHSCQILSTSPVPLLIGVWSYTMTLDFIVMVLCAVRLWTTRRNGGIAPILLRDGIAYFAAAFLSNLVQVIIASMALNPVMNIIALPFTLVVSVIAATTVFRNVFTMFDAFSGDRSQRPTTSLNNTYGGSGNSGPTSTFGGTPRTGGKRSGAGSKKHDHFALSELRSAGGIEVHRVVNVDVERDADSAHHHDHQMPYDTKTRLDIMDDASSDTTPEEKSRAL